MGVQENVDIIRRMIGWNVLQSEFQTASQKINDKRPLKIAVTISTHERNTSSDRPQLIKNRFRANIAKMPDFICILGNLLYAIRQTIVRVGQNKDAPGFFGVRVFSHVVFEV